MARCWLLVIPVVGFVWTPATVCCKHLVCCGLFVVCSGVGVVYMWLWVVCYGFGADCFCGLYRFSLVAGCCRDVRWLYSVVSGPHFGVQQVSCEPTPVGSLFLACTDWCEVGFCVSPDPCAVGCACCLHVSSPFPRALTCTLHVCGLQTSDRLIFLQLGKGRMYIALVTSNAESFRAHVFLMRTVGQRLLSR